MGTRSTIAFIQRYKRPKARKATDTELVRIYQQYDGYLSGVGKELANWLSNKTLVNGFGIGQTAKDGFCNGVGCMSAQFIHDFKIDIGGLYITSHEDREDYNYNVIADYNNNDSITIEVSRFDDEPFFKGTIEEFKALIEKDIED